MSHIFIIINYTIASFLILSYANKQQSYITLWKWENSSLNLDIQCSSKIIKPKYTSNMHIIREYEYTHTTVVLTYRCTYWWHMYAYARIIHSYMYVSSVCMSSPIVFSTVERTLLISMGIAIALKVVVKLHRMFVDHLVFLLSLFVFSPLLSVIANLCTVVWPQENHKSREQRLNYQLALLAPCDFFCVHLDPIWDTRQHCGCVLSCFVHKWIWALLIILYSDKGSTFSTKQFEWTL